MDASVIEKLKSYKSLLDDGIISEDEFEKMKSSIIQKDAGEAAPEKAETAEPDLAESAHGGEQIEPEVVSTIAEDSIEVVSDDTVRQASVLSALNVESNGKSKRPVIIAVIVGVAVIIAVVSLIIINSKSKLTGSWQGEEVKLNSYTCNIDEIGWNVELSLRDDNTAYFNFNGKEYFGTWSPSETDNTKGSLIIGENNMNIWMEGDMLCFTIIAEDTNATFYMKKMN